MAERMEAYTRAGDTCRLVYDTAGPLSDYCRERGWPALRVEMRPSRALSAARELAAYCREQGVEIIHAQYPRENVIALLASVFCPGVRVFFTSHLTITQGALWRAANRLLSPRNAAVIAVCTRGAELLRRNGVRPEKIRVIFNGVEPCPALPSPCLFREEYAIAPDTVLFLTMARYAPEKGLNELLEAVYLLKSRTSKPFCCVIAGDGEEYEAITERIRELGLERTVIQTGYREDREVLLAAADVYVSSSLYHEAMSYSILEAMSAARPLAVTDVGAGAELAAHCGFVSPPGDAEAMAEHLHILLEDDALRGSLGSAARERAESIFSLSDSLERLHSLYETTIG
ncbi:MAG: glycosyltransferase [Oscillospiraceae bacterium]|nr:glycosyltransferase [Oscillospiraceae bacterium]